jgi:hypothetical protein
MIGKGDAHPFVGCFLSRYEREPQGDHSEAALLLPPLAFPPREPTRRAPSDYDHKAPSSSFPFTAFFLFRESLKPLKLCLHTGRKKKRILEEERAQSTTLLGATCSWSPKRQWEKQVIIENLDICRLSGILV